MRIKVIYISFVRLTDKTSRDWYLDHLIERKVDVEYWDVVALVRDQYSEAAAKTTTYLRTLKSYAELERLLRLPENANAKYVILVTYAGFTVNLFRLLSKYDCRMICMVWGAAPAKQYIYWRIVLSGFANPVRLMTKIFYRVKAETYKKLKLVKKFDVVFAAGGQFMKERHYAQKVVPFNSPDYEQFKAIKYGNFSALIEESYAVFLDVNLPHHADIKVLGWPLVDADEYFKSLNHFFELLEEKYELSVVIAAHPRADYRVFNPFNGRKIFHALTPHLVKDASFVITHCSTSQSQAVLFQKPIVFVYTNEMLSVYRHNYMNEISACAEYLNAAIFNINEVYKSNQISIGKVDLIQYEKYKYSFLTSHETEDKLNPDIFWRELSTIF